MAEQRSAEEISAELEAIAARINEGGGPDFDDDDDDDDISDKTSGSTAEELAEEQKAYENEASRKGWVPKNKYKGDTAKWVDAETFIKRGERFNVNLQRQVEVLQSKIDSFEGTKAAFKKFTEETIAKKDAENKALIIELRKQKNSAVREGDDDAAAILEDRIDALKEQQLQVSALEKTDDEAAAAAGPNPNDPVLNEWIEDGNQWFNDNDEMRRYAIALGENFIQNDKKEGVRTETGRPFLDRLTEAMQKNFPRQFKKLVDNGKRPNGGETGGKGGSNGGAGGKSERDLPEEDLKLMKQFIAEGWTTREKFLASYFSR